MRIGHQDPGMATRERRGDAGSLDARRIAIRAVDELRETRLAAGVSQAAIARAAGISTSQLSRLERNDIAEPTIDQMCRVARALGLDTSVRFYPSGAPVRDRGQLAALARFETMLAPPLVVRREAALPIPGDRRAWDGLIFGGSETFFEEGESHFRDIQALARRVELKLRDDPRGRVVVLVVARTAHNLRVLAEHRETLRTQFPLDGPAIARAVRRGAAPPLSGIILV
jgi:transcriptional regulator with XRE-family HTH domain